MRAHPEQGLWIEQKQRAKAKPAVAQGCVGPDQARIARLEGPALNQGNADVSLCGTGVKKLLHGFGSEKRRVRRGDQDSFRRSLLCPDPFQSPKDILRSGLALRQGVVRACCERLLLRLL